MPWSADFNQEKFTSKWWSEWAHQWVSKFAIVSDNLFITFYVFVVVQFCFWFNLDFPLFFSMLIYDNEYQTKENPNWTKNKIELQHIHGLKMFGV